MRIARAFNSQKEKSYSYMTTPEWVFQAVWIRIANILFFFLNRCKMFLFAIRTYIYYSYMYVLDVKYCFHP